ncbi:hypothetical protein GM50_8765 [freshwater metagenome]|jgi:hypothetical protein|uniref:DnaA N-terminal domain-containing protein n=1 Tax=freshwater metagenome TaxID=449393 RepID=A0A094Q4Z3_9ZZZZ
MSTSPTLADLRSRWNEVLDILEKNDRIIWMAFFDARLASLEDSVLTLDYSDSAKFGGAHGYSNIRVKQLELLQDAIKQIFGVELEIRQIP